MAVLFVMGILTITLAVSYAMLHSQTIDIAIHRNVERTGDARQAAITQEILEVVGGASAMG